MKWMNNWDLNKNEIQNVKLQNLGADPGGMTASDQGLIWINTVSNLVKHYDGTTVQLLTNALESVAGSGAIGVTGVAGKSQTISIVAASAGAAGTMSTTDFNKLANAASVNTVNTLVLRDGSGNFTAGTITAALTGTASNASSLNSQAAAYYLARGNHSGTQFRSTISDFDAGVQATRLDQMAAPTVDLSLNTRKITNLGNPTTAQDATTKYYVDSVATGLDVKLSCRVGSVVNVAMTYTATGGTSARGQMTLAPNSVDGITLAVTNRVLLKNQTVPAQNGIWVVSTLGTGANGIWDRAPSFDSDIEVTSGAFTFIEEGTQAGTGWVLTTPNPIILGGASGTGLAFSQFSGAGSYIAGAGLTQSGLTFNAIGTANRITVAADSIDIASNYAGQNTITTLGTVTTGIWQGTDVAVADGGTGASTAAGAKTNLGFPTKYAVTIGDAAATSITVTHNLNTLDVIHEMNEVASGAVVMGANPVHATVNTMTFAFAVAPALNALRVTVMG